MMKQGKCVRIIAMALLAASSFAVRASAQDRSKCKSVHADLVELRNTTDCKPGHTVCFLGQVDGNHGLRGTTYFHPESGAPGPSTSPDFGSYSGSFEYTTDAGTLIIHETGLNNPTVGSPDQGVVSAYQKIVDATGEFVGVTGHFFVSGFNRSGQVTTSLFGEICYP